MDYKELTIEALVEAQGNLILGNTGEAIENIKVAIDYLTYVVNDKSPYDIQPQEVRRRTTQAYGVTPKQRLSTKAQQKEVQPKEGEERMATIIIKLTTPEGQDPYELFKDSLNQAWCSNSELRNLIDQTEYEVEYAE